MGTQVYLGIGSNLNRDNAILFAIEQLQPLFSDFKRSPVYESKAIREAEPNFLNMVVGGVPARVIRPVMEGLKQAGEDFRMLIMPDHPTPLATMTHSAEPVPFLLYDSAKPETGAARFTEAEAARGPYLDDASRLMELLILRK